MKFRRPWVSGREIERLPELGTDGLLIAPWLHSPRDMRTWVGESEDAMRLDIKRKVLERYAAEIIRSSVR